MAVPPASSALTPSILSSTLTAHANAQSLSSMLMHWPRQSGKSEFLRLLQSPLKTWLEAEMLKRKLRSRVDRSAPVDAKALLRQLAARRMRKFGITLLEQPNGTWELESNPGSSYKTPRHAVSCIAVRAATTRA